MGPVGLVDGRLEVEVDLLELELGVCLLLVGLMRVGSFSFLFFAFSLQDPPLFSFARFCPFNRGMAMMIIL
jgi:hypothetical protein